MKRWSVIPALACAIAVLVVRVAPCSILLARYSIILATYLAVVLMLWFEPDWIRQVSLDKLTVIVLGLMAFVRARVGIPREMFWLVPVQGVGICLVVVSILRWRKIPEVKWKWVLRGGAFSLLALVPMVLVDVWQGRPGITDIANLRYGPVLLIVRNVFYQLSFVSPFEEIAFRGLLWGYLRDCLSWQERKAMVGQALVFWLLHIPDLLTSPDIFFVHVVIATVSFSLLTYFSRQISPAIAMHTMINAVLPVAVYYIVQWL